MRILRTVQVPIYENGQRTDRTEPRQLQIEINEEKLVREMTRRCARNKTLVAKEIDGIIVAALK